tara:strand:- start:1198 stop:1392 length:195 start_codon:yes stop_codon:yes gene_type:complete
MASNRSSFLIAYSLVSQFEKTCIAVSWIFDLDGRPDIAWQVFALDFAKRIAESAGLFVLRIIFV